ncbi:MAG: restriction endonuclease subunit S [Anaerovoracaceae bacterium]
MHKDIKALVPELRFPGFEGEWEKKPLNDICSITNGKANAQDHVDGGKYPLFDRSEIIKASNEYLFDTETVIIPGEGMRFVPKYFKGKFNLHQRAYALMNFNYNGEFIYYSLSNQNNLLAKKAVQSTVLSLRLPILQNFPLAISENSKEQQKVADCLSSLDAVIDGHSKCLELLREHKRGLMQQLFPQEGEKVPRLRFLEFKGDGQWREMTLDKVCNLVRGPFGGALKKEIFVNDGFAVYEQSHAIYNDFKNFRYRINKEKFLELKRFSVKQGDLIMSCSGTMGKFAIIPVDLEEGIINQALLKLTTKGDFNNHFVKISLETETNQRKLLSKSAGGAIKNVVSVSQIKELKLQIPSLTEQQKIADCLSSLDNLIDAEERRIEQLQLHKKGLMQKLFPVIND